MNRAEDRVIEDFGFKDKGEYNDWVTTLTPDIRKISGSGFTHFLVTDGDCGAIEITGSSEVHDALEFHPITGQWASVPIDMLYQIIAGVEMELDEAI